MLERRLIFAAASQGSARYRWRIPNALDLIATGKAEVDRLISARYALPDIVAAMKAIEEHSEKNFKTMIHLRPQ